MFPIDITFKKKLSPEFDIFSNKEIITLFSEEFAYSGCKINENGEVKFSVPNRSSDLVIHPNMKENKRLGISKTSFEINNSNAPPGRTAIYSFNVGQTILIEGIIVLIIAVISKFNMIVICTSFMFFLVHFAATLLIHYSPFSSFFRRLKYEAKKENQKII
jgi:hypothetical protein